MLDDGDVFAKAFGKCVACESRGYFHVHRLKEYVCRRCLRDFKEAVMASRLGYCRETFLPWALLRRAML